MPKKSRKALCDPGEIVDGLAPTRIRRHYTCAECDLKTTNPREYLHHKRDVHNEKVKIVECPHCQYACQYSQKLQRHVLLVHKISSKILANSRFSNPKSHERPRIGDDEKSVCDDDSSEFGYPGSFNSGDDYTFTAENIVITPDIPYYTSAEISSSSSSYSSAEDYSNMYTSVRGLSNCMANSILQPNIRYISPPPYLRSFPIKPRKVFKCAYCTFSHYSHSLIVSHLSKHAGRKPYKCKYCSFSSNCKEVVMHHLSSRHDKKSSKEVVQLLKYKVSKFICRIVNDEEDGVNTQRGMARCIEPVVSSPPSSQENSIAVLKDSCNEEEKLC